jgi:NitT/TauT family transport system substrate-binding protein
MRSSLRAALGGGWGLLAVAAVWLILISTLHAHLDREEKGRPVVRMGYMPVLANLACPLLDEASKSSGAVRFEAVKFSSFAEMGQAVRERHIDAAFLIAPLAVVLRQQGAPVKVVYIGNRHESTLVVRNGLAARSFADLAGHTLAVPQRFSGHSICAREQQQRLGIVPPVRIVEMNPPDMPSALASGAIDAYFVGEPFGYASVYSGRARVLHRVEDLWPGFICNLMIVHEQMIADRPELVRRLVEGAARSGIWAQGHREEAAAIAASRWGQPLPFVRAMFAANLDRVVWDRFVPRQEEIDDLASRMARLGLLTLKEPLDVVEPRFATGARLDDVHGLESILQPGS